MKLTLTRPVVADFAALAHTMRPDEIEQFVAFSGMESYDAEVAAASFIGAAGPKFALIDENSRAVLAGGFVPISPGVSEAWMAGTMEAWEKHGMCIVRHARRLIDAMLEQDCHRVQIICLASREKAQDFYVRGLGMTREGLLRRYTTSGVDAIMYAKVREG